MALLPSHLCASSLGSKSSWLVLSLLFGCTGAFSFLPAPVLSFNPCLLSPVSDTRLELTLKPSDILEIETEQRNKLKYRKQ